MSGIQSASTAAERSARLQAILDGTATSRSVRHSGTANLLFGVALHAAAKSGQGGQLTELEQQLLDTMARLLPADEIAAAGRAFTEAQGRAGGMSLFSPQVAALPATASYGRAELRADIAALAPEVLKQPNVRVVKVADLEAGQPFDTPEFIEAMAEYGSGATVFTGPRADRSSVSQSVFARLHLDEFQCIQRTGDSFFGPSDEIYWMAAAGSDKGAETTYASPEFGNIDNGSRRAFPENTLWFRGHVQQVLLAHMECWEKDRGSFWEAIRDALISVADKFSQAAEDIIEDEESEPDDSWLAVVVADIARFLANILDWLLGKDDLIQHRTFAFNRSALNYIAMRGETLDFKGQNAHYKLKISAIVGKRTLHYVASRGAGSWGSNAPVGYQGDQPRFVTPYGDRLPDSVLYLAYIDDRGYLAIGFIGAGNTPIWRPEVEFDPQSTKGLGAPSAIVRQEESARVITVLASNLQNPRECYVFSYSGYGRWSRRTMTLPSSAASGPAVALSPDLQRLLCLWVSGGQPDSGPAADQVLSAELPYPIGQGDFERVAQIGAMSSGAVAMATFQGVVHCVFRGHASDKGLWWTKRTPSGGWEEDRRIPGHEALGGPSLAVAEGKLHCVYRGANDDLVWHMSLDRGDGSWSAASPIPGAVTVDSPTIGTRSDVLWCVYTRPPSES